ncbi:alpha/beta hydrolase [Longimycelium tulufanense]|uniref:Alpha/beta hydrolase n=1 Tax=Longimycelium tulufanense TaxID=907463 RepID=A0A8J3CB00_9PSEU|nr:alpha/beta hydrolase [Longimycelium tulufanense]GGM42432.1 alpha/beta hydrolase [Longimycelium tulufanense]
MSLPSSQISPHRASRVELSGRWGPLAALHRPARATGNEDGTDDGGTNLGAVALLVPGYTGSKEDFAPLLDPLAEAGIEVLAVDLPGQYESAGPADEPAYLPGPLGATLVPLVEALAGGNGLPGRAAFGPRPVILVGHSYGGLVARGAVLAGAPASGLVLLDSGPGQLPDGERRQALELAEPLLRAQGIEAVQRLREAREAAHPRWARLPLELKDFYRRRFLASHPAALLGMAHGLRSEPDRVEALADRLRARGVPCLVACGAEDDAWSVAAQREMAERLGADFAVIPGAAHSPNVENPEGLLATLLPTLRSWLA